MTDNKNEEFPIVDEMGNILGAITRGHAHDGCKILHPVVHLHVFNSKGELYPIYQAGYPSMTDGAGDTVLPYY